MRTANLSISAAGERVMARLAEIKAAPPSRRYAAAARNDLGGAQEDFAALRVDLRRRDLLHGSARRRDTRLRDPGRTASIPPAW